MESITKGECPAELDPGSKSQQVSVNLVRSEKPYEAPPKPKYKAFSGSGQTLAGRHDCAPLFLICSVQILLQWGRPLVFNTYGRIQVHACITAPFQTIPHSCRKRQQIDHTSFADNILFCTCLKSSNKRSVLRGPTLQCILLDAGLQVLQEVHPNPLQGQLHLQSPHHGLVSMILNLLHQSSCACLMVHVWWPGST